MDCRVSQALLYPASAGRERVHGLQSISHERVRQSLPLHPILGAPGHDCAGERKIGLLMATEIKPFSDG
jgi:hypothetical protein